MDRGAWRTTVHRVAKSQTQLKRRGMHTELVLGFPGGSDGKSPSALQETRVQFPGQEGPLEKEMVTHTSIFA